MPSKCPSQVGSGCQRVECAPGPPLRRIKPIPRMTPCRGKQKLSDPVAATVSYQPVINHEQRYARKSSLRSYVHPIIALTAKTVCDTDFHWDKSRPLPLRGLPSLVDAHQSRMPSQITVSVAQLTTGRRTLGQKWPTVDSTPALSRWARSSSIIDLMAETAAESTERNIDI
jgi:hypothetical protein